MVIRRTQRRRIADSTHLFCADDDFMLGRWRSLPPIPTRDGVSGKRCACACVALPGGGVAVLGGHGPDGKALARADRFDLSTGEWSALPDMLTARTDFGAVVVGRAVRTTTFCRRNPAAA